MASCLLVSSHTGHRLIFKPKVSQSIRQTWQFLQLKQSLYNYSDQTLKTIDNVNLQVQYLLFIEKFAFFVVKQQSCHD